MLGRFPDLDTLAYSAGGVPRFEVNNFTRSSSRSSALSCPLVPSIPPFLPPHIVGDCKEGHHCGYHEIGKFFLNTGKTWDGEYFSMQKSYTNVPLISKVGNSGYGKTITNQLKHRNVEYCSDAEVTQKVNTPLFRKLNNIAEDTYKVESC